jgi:hypothetical protein
MEQKPLNTIAVASGLNERGRTLRRSRRSSLIFLAGILILSTGASAQTMIPVATKLPAPEGLSFQGRWKCEDASTKATLQVGGRGPRHPGWRNVRLAPAAWTQLTETDQNRAAHFLVAYERDKHQFILMDADDPAYGVYSTDGWRDRELTLTSKESTDQQRPKHRFVYKVLDAHQFTVTYAVWQDAAWASQSNCTCRKVSGH